MDNPYSAYSAVYGTPMENSTCNQQQVPGGFTSTAQLSEYLDQNKTTATQMQNNNMKQKNNSLQPTTPAQMMQQQLLTPITDFNQPYPVTGESLQYLNGFLRTQIGKKVRVEFLIGTNTMLDKFGTLLAVGANYILIREADTDDILACDFYNIKFVRFYY